MGYIAIAIWILVVAVHEQVTTLEVANAQTPQEEEVVIEEPQEVRIEVVYTKEGIERLIRETFPESPDIAVAIAKCESGLVPSIQSRTIWRGERERSFGIFQIHMDSWHNTALGLGLDKYQTDVEQNIQMARYIYDNAGQRWSDWSCYTKNMI